MAGVAADVAAGQLDLADVVAVHLHRAYGPLDDLLSASAGLVDDLLARLAASFVAVEVAGVPAREELAALLEADRLFGAAFDWSGDDPVPASAPERLVDLDVALSALAYVAPPRAEVDAAVHLLPAVLEAGVPQAVGRGDTALSLAPVDPAVLLVFADLLAQILF